MKECKYCKINHDGLDVGASAPDREVLISVDTYIGKGKHSKPLFNYTVSIWQSKEGDAILELSANAAYEDFGGGGIDNHVAIKYCPMCGRKL